jgi:hypothetical protein
VEPKRPHERKYFSYHVRDLQQHGIFAGEKQSLNKNQKVIRTLGLASPAHSTIVPNTNISFPSKIESMPANPEDAGELQKHCR